MDDYPGKQAVRKGSGLILREGPNNRERNGQFCNRVGCSGRLNSTKCAQIAKPRPLVRTGKEIIGSSSRKPASVTNPRISTEAPCRKLSSHLESDSSETSSLQDEPELIVPPVKIQRGILLGAKNNSPLMEVKSSITRSQRSVLQKSVSGSQASSSGSKSPTVKSTASSTKYGLRNLRCNSISDIVPSNSPSSDSSLRRMEALKKRNCEGESSSNARGKKINGSPSVQNPSSSSVTVSDTRKGRNIVTKRDNGAVLTRNQRPINSQTRARISNQGSRNSSSLVISERSHPEMSVDMIPDSSHSFNRSGGRHENTRATLTSERSDSLSRYLERRGNLRRLNLDGIEEVLSALDRIENYEDLTFEQILALETNYFLDGMSFYDQHREMRLDIDNMSYEELLALEEKMGNVSTALTEEALSKCLKRSVYGSSPLKSIVTGRSVHDDDDDDDDDDNDDLKCSICQEEYVDGDEMGKLQCEHKYHMACAQQWLRLKNWCPVCKVSASPFSS